MLIYSVDVTIMFDSTKASFEVLNMIDLCCKNSPKCLMEIHALRIIKYLIIFIIE